MDIIKNNEKDFSNLKYPKRTLDFSAFKNITEETLLTPDELNFLGTIFEKDYSIADLELLLAIHCHKKVTNFDIRTLSTFRDYKVLVLHKSAVDSILPNSIREKLINSNKHSILKLKQYNLIKIYYSQTEQYIDLTEIGLKVLYEFMNTKQVPTLLEELYNKVK